MSEKFCPECGGFEMNSCSDGLYCRNCGLVIDEAQISSNPYIPKAVKNRANLPELATAGTMPPKGRIQHQWFLTTRQKNLYRAKKRLDMISSKLKLPKPVEQDAYIIFKTAVEKEINIGRDNKTMLFGCVYASCIMHGIPKT